MNIFKSKLLVLAIIGGLLVPSVASAADHKYFQVRLTQGWQRIEPSRKYVDGHPNKVTKGSYYIDSRQQANKTHMVHHLIDSNGKWVSDGRMQGKSTRRAYPNWGEKNKTYRLEVRLPQDEFGKTSWFVGTWAADNN